MKRLVLACVALMLISGCASSLSDKEVEAYATAVSIFREKKSNSKELYIAQPQDDGVVVERLSEDRFKITSYYEAVNGWGVRVHQVWDCVMQYEGGGMWGMYELETYLPDNPYPPYIKLKSNPEIAQIRGISPMLIPLYKEDPELLEGTPQALYSEGKLILASPGENVKPLDAGFFRSSPWKIEVLRGPFKGHVFYVNHDFVDDFAYRDGRK